MKARVILTITTIACLSLATSSGARDTQRWNYGSPGYPSGNERYNNPQNFGGPPQGSIINPYRLRAPNGRGFRVYSDGPIAPGSPLNPFRIRPE